MFEISGRCFAKPVVRQNKVNPPKLKNLQVFYKNQPAGEIYASFELILVCFLNSDIIWLYLSLSYVSFSMIMVIETGLMNQKLAKILQQFILKLR